MPYPFVLPTTSAFSYSSSFTCDSHPSLPLAASTHRGVVRDVLKTHKRLPPSSQPSNLPTIISAIHNYLPHLLAVDSGLNHRTIGNGDEIFSIIQRSSATPDIEWRPTLSDVSIPGKKENARVRIHSLEHEVAFVLATLGYTYTLLARAALHPLFSTTTTTEDLYAIGSQSRQTAVSTATRHLLDAASVYDYLARRAERPHHSSPSSSPPPCADVTAATARAQCELALAEATLLAVLKDDPYPAVVAQDRNKNDKEWMYKAPDIPKVRAHLFARLCLAAAEHAAKAHSLCASQGVFPGGSGIIRFGSKKGPGEGEDGGVSGGGGSGKINEGFVKYLEDLRRSSRAKACRFFGVDAELGGQTGNAIGWLQAALQELGVDARSASEKSSGLSRLKKEWTEKREDRKVEKGTTWGADAGKLEEMRVIEMLEAKWTKQNDTMFTQAITPAGTLLAQMPSAREIHTVKPYNVPVLDSLTLNAMRAPPDRDDDFGEDHSSDEETVVARPSYAGSVSSYY
ncbi:pH-response regulator protein palC [Cytospora mali]|uniref:pH-response regulator protein palC n=1 Tax=Cytospora mali TaxID=578113 RepID=A0A194VQV1_CYTMA|nr:pH-response regulator protein palC [Valsa mali]